MESERPLSWQDVVLTAILVFAIAFVGCVIAAMLWLQDLATPQVAILGSGNRLSLLVSDGPSRLVLATGDDPIQFENALICVSPIFARRINVLLIAGSGRSLNVPLAVRGNPHVRTLAALAPLPRTAEAAEIGRIREFTTPQRIQLGPNVSVTVETVLPFGADPEEDFPAWRAIIARGATRVAVLSDSEAAALFPPVPASVLVVSGDDPVAAWELAPAVVLVSNAESIGGPELRAAFSEEERGPRWGLRVFPGEALRLRFAPGGIEIPAEPAQQLTGTPQAVLAAAPAKSVVRVRRRGRLSPARTPP